MMETGVHGLLADGGGQLDLWGGGKFRPDRSPVVRAEIAACDGCPGGLLNGGAVLNGDLSPRRLPLVHSGAGDAKDGGELGLGAQGSRGTVHGMSSGHFSHDRSIGFVDRVGQAGLDAGGQFHLYSSRMEINDWVAAARKHKQLTLEQLGNRLSGTPGKANVSAWEKGRHSPSFGHLKEIARVTGYSMAPILKDVAHLIGEVQAQASEPQSEPVTVHSAIRHLSSLLVGSSPRTRGTVGRLLSEFATDPREPDEVADQINALVATAANKRTASPGSPADAGVTQWQAPQTTLSPTFDWGSITNWSFVPPEQPKQESQERKEGDQ